VSPTLQNKVAIVTGAATGIGKAIALVLGRAGVKVVVNHLDTPDSAERSRARSLGRVGRGSLSPGM
jgi:NAD(P)-dependent dehydrogenase (short-subunit alcohol dehydrogenase family)